MPARLALIVTVLAAELTAAAGAQPTPGEPHPTFTFAQALALAERSSLDLAVGRQSTDVARSEMAVASLPPNPELTFESARETPNDAASVAQTIETAGKRRRRGELASATVATREAELAARRQALRGQVRRAFYGLLAAERQATETSALAAMAERARDAASQRFAAGEVARLEVLATELAAAQAANDAALAVGTRAAARAGLNALLALPLATESATFGSLSEGAVPDAPAAIAAAKSGSLELAVLDHQLAEQQARVALEHALRVPDLTLQGTVTHRSAPEFDWGWRAALTIPLPIFTHHAAALTVAEQTLGQLTTERQAREAALVGAVAAAHAVATARAQQLQRFVDHMLPAALELAAMAEDAYRSGQSDLPTMLAVLASTRDVELRAIAAGAEYQTSLADLEDAMGVALP